MLTKMDFEFTDREGTGLQVINDMLRNTKFADLKEESEQVHKRWMEAYPNRRMISQIMINFENASKNGIDNLWCNIEKQ